MIWASTVSEPTFSALNLITPFLFILAPVTLSPTFFSTGILSPVSIDSSTDVWPSTTTPSTGILLPGFTIIISPTSTSSIGISISWLPFTIKAVLGWSPISFLIASPVLPLDLDSKYFPSNIKAIIIPALSKYNWWCPWFTSIVVVAILNVVYALYKNAADVPIATSVSIFGFLFISDLNPLT